MLNGFSRRKTLINRVCGCSQRQESGVERHLLTVPYHVLADLFDTYILSTAPWENPSAWSDKAVWVRRHLGTVAHKRLILTHHKHLNHGDFLIDDRTANGADRFGGEHLLFGSGQYPDWDSVVAYLRLKAL